jgi:DNA-binding transcriptional LysR family regulator
MKMPKSYRFFLMGLISSILISACGPFVTNTPPPSPQPIQVAFTPILSPLVDRLHQCALQHPEIALITHQTTIIGLEETGADLILWMGEPPQGNYKNAFTLSEDTIVIIAGASVTQKFFSTDQLRDLYSNPKSTYQVWTYPPGHELRNLFDQVVMGEIATNANALLAPNSAAMLEAIAADPLAVGYIPISWLEKDIQTIAVEDELQGALTQPVLVLTRSEPIGNLRTYLVCLQAADR